MSAALATPALTMHKRSFSSPEMGALVDHEYPDPSPIRSHASERNLEQMGARLGDRQEEALVEVSSARAHRTFPETRGACGARGISSEAGESRRGSIRSAAWGVAGSVGVRGFGWCLMTFCSRAISLRSHVFFPLI